MTTSFCWRSYWKSRQATGWYVNMLTIVSKLLNAYAIKRVTNSQIDSKLYFLCCTVKRSTSCLWIHSFSSFQTTEDYKHLPPSPNGQGQSVHSSSQNWLTQGHSWNMGGTCGRDLSYTKDIFKKACHRGQPCDRCRALPAEPSWLPSEVERGGSRCLQVCGCMRMRNVNWESIGGDNDVSALSAPHRKTFYWGTYQT